MKKLFLVLVLCLFAGTMSVFADENNYLSSEKSVSVEAGKQVTIPIYLTNTDPIAGLQFDLYPTEGISLAYTEKRGKKYYTITLDEERADAATHSTTITLRDDQDPYFFRVISTPVGAEEIYYGNSGIVYNVTFDVDPKVATGEYVVKLSNIVLANRDGLKSYYQDPIEVVIKVTNATGIKGVNATEDAEYYNGLGMGISKAKCGLTIIKKKDGTVVKTIK